MMIAVTDAQKTTLRAQPKLRCVPGVNTSPAKQASLSLDTHRDARQICSIAAALRSEVCSGSTNLQSSGLGEQRGQQWSTTQPFDAARTAPPEKKKKKKPSTVVNQADGQSLIARAPARLAACLATLPRPRKRLRACV